MAAKEPIENNDVSFESEASISSSEEEECYEAPQVSSVL